jgi:uncharacterized protein YjiS (DUF1127 family)
MKPDPMIMERALPLLAGPAAPRTVDPEIVAPGIVARVLGAVDTVRSWRYRARSRAALATLDEHLLRDIGLTEADVPRECGKPFWKV